MRRINYFSSEELRSQPPRPPPLLPAASPKRRFVKLGRKTSDGSQQSAVSTGSSSTNRSAEGVDVRQPSKSLLRRHTNRLSGVFLRNPASSSGPMALTAGIRSSLSVYTKKDGMNSADALRADDPSELSNQITAPGILKIFGTEICEGAHYKSVLATTHSCAKELVKEALERYGLAKEEAESYVLCDTIGSTGDRWTTQGFRVVGDNEKPLLLQSLWKPREGLARRFEIQRRSSVEEKTSKDKDTVTAGINAQARKLQKSRSRVSSTLIERTQGRGYKLWRSQSQTDLLDTESTHRDAHHDEGRKDRSESLNQSSAQSYESPQQTSLAAPNTESLCPARPRGEREAEESEREETESSDDNTTQYSIHPPHDCPYLLLLKGHSLAQDFVIYLLAGPKVVFGQKGAHEDSSKPDMPLYADDILLRHCCFHRDGVGRPTLLCPCEDALVTRNSQVLREEVLLNPGDVIGMGERYLFLFKDPLALSHKEAKNAAPEPGITAVPWMLGQPNSTTARRSHAKEMILCNTCIMNCVDLQSPIDNKSPNRGPPCLKSAQNHNLTLRYENQDEDRIVREIVAMGSSKDRPPLTVAFLLSLCVQYSSTCLHSSDLRRLLLLFAGAVQNAVWEHTKDLAAVQPEVPSGQGSNPEYTGALSLHEVISGLRPLVVWMSNSLELLHFIQLQLPLALQWRTLKEQGLEDGEDNEAENFALFELHLSCVRSASEETMAVLEEVIMLAFQQCVYYITKLLYPILPGLLDCSPFTERSEAGHTLTAPAEIQHLVEVLTRTWRLLSDCQLHTDISSQLIGYLFYFIGASLFNSLMERGSEPGFYQWSIGVRLRVNLDLLLAWAHTAGLGELALEHTRTLSSAINLLATPRKNLLQSSWMSLRSDYPALSASQLNHMLSLYSPGSVNHHSWTPSVQEQAAAHRTADILESFDTHHPLVLPDGGYCFTLRGKVTDSALGEQLDKLREFISTMSHSQAQEITATDEKKYGASHSMEPKVTEMDFLPEVSVETLDDTSRPSVELLLSPSTIIDALPPSPPPCPSPTLDKGRFSSSGGGGALLLSKKLRNLELQSRESETGETRRSSLQSGLLTPPNTPGIIDPPYLPLKAYQDELVNDNNNETLPCWSSGIDEHDQGGLVFECLSALKVDGLQSHRPGIERFIEVKEEVEEGEGDEADDLYDENNDELFSLELERGERGLGLALVDTRDTCMRVKGIFIRAVAPDSPAARCEKLLPGDRILAVNGVSLLGLDYHSGKELIQSSGDRLRLLVARSYWMAQAMQAEC